MDTKLLSLRDTKINTIMIKLSYTDKVSIKVILLAIISVLAVPYYFTAGGTLVGFIIIRLFGTVVGGVNTIAHHRWLTHRSFVPHAPGRYLMWTSLILAANGRPAQLVIGHRLHHVHTDTALDPHSPNNHSWINLWLGRFNISTGSRPPKDFYRDKEAVFVNKHYWMLYALFNIALALIDFKTALLFCPVTFTLNWILSTIINYNGHVLNGVVEPRNMGPVIAWLTCGEGLHKNHHSNQASYSFASPDRFDLGAFVIEKFLMAKAPLK
jgi:fatty-acid desaturase